MFSRTFLRASQRSCASPLRPQSHAIHLQTFAKLPSRTRIPRHQCIARRNASTVASAKKLFKESPFLFPLAGFTILVGMAGMLYLPYYYQTYIIAPYHNFPEPVAKKLRRAIFYSSGSNVDVREANKYFRQGILLANELGMDPFSDEILGVKIAIAAMFEKEHHYNLSIEVLEILRKDCVRWIEEVGSKHWNDGKRTKIMAKTVELNVKLGELYSNKYVQNTDAAEERLVEAVETILREKQRREKDGVKPGEGEWMSDEEVGGSLEALGHHYEEKELHYLAAPLFLQALTLCPPRSCHSVVLMNNLSICLAQQTPSPAPDALPNDTPHVPLPTRTIILDQARQWAAKALASAAVITPPDRTEECDQGCAVATHNLGEFAEMEGKVAEARTRYREAAGLARAVGFREGEGKAREGLERLRGKE